MSWVSARTWVTGEVVRARYLNHDIRDNLRARTGVFSAIATSETTTSATFTDLTTVGPSVTLSLSTEPDVFFGATLDNTVLDGGGVGGAFMTVAGSGPQL